MYLVTKRACKKTQMPLRAHQSQNDLHQIR